MDKRTKAVTELVDAIRSVNERLTHIEEKLMPREQNNTGHNWPKGVFGGRCTKCGATSHEAMQGKGCINWSGDEPSEASEVAGRWAERFGEDYRKTITDLQAEVERLRKELRDAEEEVDRVNKLAVHYQDEWNAEAKRGERARRVLAEDLTQAHVDLKRVTEERDKLADDVAVSTAHKAAADLAATKS